MSAEPEAQLAEFRALLERTRVSFERLRELPPFGARASVERAYRKAFSVSHSLWTFQQQHRQQLTQAGLRRWELGEAASLIGQLYHAYYLRTSDGLRLASAHTFFAAIRSRGYFADAGVGGDSVAHAAKRLRYYVRFVVVAMLLNKREEVQALLPEFTQLVRQHTPALEASEAEQWRAMVRELHAFLGAESLLTQLPWAGLRMRAGAAPPSGALACSSPLTLGEAVLCSSSACQVKFGELTVEVYRMLQALEWDMGGADAPPQFDAASADGSGSDPLEGMNPHKTLLHAPTVRQLLLLLATASEELPPNSVILLYLSAAAAAALPPTPAGDGAGGTVSPAQTRGAAPGRRGAAATGVNPLVMASPHGSSAHLRALGAAGGHGAERSPSALSNHSVASDASFGVQRAGVAGAQRAGGVATAGGGPSVGPVTPASARGPGDRAADEGGGAAGTPHGLAAAPAGWGDSTPAADDDASHGQGGGSGARTPPLRSGGQSIDGSADTEPRSPRGGLRLSYTPTSVRGPQDDNCVVFPSDLLPFTRQPLFLIVDAAGAGAFASLAGAERGESCCCLLAPAVAPPLPVEVARIGLPFTLFLTSPIAAACLLLGVRHPPPGGAAAAAEALREASAAWGDALVAAPGAEYEAWVRVMGDPFLRAFVMRFVLCRGLLGLHRRAALQPGCQPQCCPPLPAALLPGSDLVVRAVHAVASALGRRGEVLPPVWAAAE